MNALKIGNSEFFWGTRTYVMGVLNITPDSFSGDGLLAEVDFVEAAVAQAKLLVAEGADILDVGGESTRPGSEQVSEADELQRIIPVVQAISQAIQIPISIDTYKANVAREAITAGAHCINDVWAGLKEPAMYGVAAELNVPVILMHNASSNQHVHRHARLGDQFLGNKSKDIVAEISRALRSLAENAEKQSVPHEHIILDPGFGFGKTVAQNLELVRCFDKFTELGYPLLAGVSRKSFVGYTLDAPPGQRLEGTLAATVLCAERGADIVRVHDVGAVSRALKLTDVISRNKRNRDS